MNTIINNVLSFDSELLIIASIGLILILLIINMIRLSKLNKKHKIFMDALSDKDVEKLLIENLEIVKKVSEESKRTEEEVSKIKNILKSCFQKYGVERYTAFEDVGSDLSFAIALLDGKDDGVILNGIYSREGSSVYAKPVYNGETKHHISQEEKKALERAKRRGIDY